jgi:hypothetical protein
MGNIYYGNDPEPATFPDRILAHLKVVLATKLRRNESFTLSWTHSGDEAPGRSTLWIHPSIPLRFVFDNPEPEALDPVLVKSLANSANSSGGLNVDFALLEKAGATASSRPAA